MIEMIVAMGLDGAIGKNNGLLWDLKDDMKHFVKVTKGRTVVMGMNTFNSLPKGPLKGRENIVITNQRKESYIHDDNTTVLFVTYETFLELKVRDYVVIGGAQIYELFKANVDKIHLTLVFDVFPEADVYFPSLNINEWVPHEAEFYPADERNQFPFHIVEMTRR